MKYLPGDLAKGFCLSWKPQFGARSYTILANNAPFSSTTMTEMHLSPMELAVSSSKQLPISIIPDLNSDFKCVFNISAQEIFQQFRVLPQSETTLSVVYKIIPDAPREMNYYILAETESPKHVFFCLSLEEEKDSTSQLLDILLHNVPPEKNYYLYALAFSQDCMKWAVPKVIKIGN